MRRDVALPRWQTAIEVCDAQEHAGVHLGAIVFGSNEIPCLADVAGTTLSCFQYPDWRGGFEFDLDQGAKARRITSL
jgi:hypothetical protein